MKLNHYIAVSGITSRRKAVDFIKAGRVKVNGIIVKEPGYDVQENDCVICGGKVIKPEKKKIYILLNKPAGYVTTLSDEKGRKTVIDLVSKKIKERIFPVGRLDYATSGLLLLTNDGDVAHTLAHPSSRIKKSYHVTLDREVPESIILRIKKGIKLSDGLVVVDHVSFWSNEQKNQLKIVLHSGKYRILRRLFTYLGYTVRSLDRFEYAGLTKKGLGRGELRNLTDREVEMLKKVRSRKDDKRKKNEY